MWSAKLIMMNLGKAVLALGTLRLQSLGAVRKEAAVRLSGWSKKEFAKRMTEWRTKRMN